MYLLFDIGGTKIRFALSEDGYNISNVLTYTSINNYSELIKFIKEKKEEISNGKKIDFISGGIAGVVRNNELISSPHLDALVNKSLWKDLVEIFETNDILIKNDAALAGLGEATFGNGKEYNTVAYIGIGTGVGGARIVNKRIEETNFGYEPGHQIIDYGPNGYVTLEKVISGSGIYERTKQRPHEIKDYYFWRDIEMVLAYGLNNVILHWCPDIIVLGGGIVNGGYIDIENLNTILEGILKIYPKLPKIKSCSLKDQVGLYGALYNLKINNA